MLCLFQYLRRFHVNDHQQDCISARPAVPESSIFVQARARTANYSIKAVLPAIMPELSYKNLQVQDGGQASQLFLELFHESDLQILGQKRTDLKEYCKRGVEAMMMILDFLRYKTL